MADQPPGTTTLRGALSGLAPTLVVNGVLPYALFQVLTGRGVGTVQALAATSVFPLGWTAIGWLRSRRLDAIAAISLVLIAIGLIISLASGNARFYLVRESVLSAAFGLGFLGTLLLPRPAMFWLGRQFATGGDPARIAWWNGLWQFEAFRRGMRLMTAVWGVGLTAESCARVILALTARPATVLAVSPFLGFGTVALLLVWTFRHSARMRRAGEAATAATSRA